MTSDSVPRTARQRYLQALMDEFDAYDWEESGRLDDWLKHADAIEAEAGAAPLDVEVLAKALTYTFHGKPPGWEVSVHAPYQQRADAAFCHLAHDIAAEYARLSKGTDR